MADSPDFVQVISADPAKFVSGMNVAIKSATSMSDEINKQFKGVASSIGKLTSGFAAFAGVIAGGGALKKFIDDTNSWNGEAGKMAKLLGVSTQQASVLNVALNHLGIDADVYTSAAEKMSKQIQGNAQAFEVLGVKTRDASGAYRPVTELMGEVNEKLAAIKNPIEQNIAGQQVYGRGWSEVRAILKLTKGGMDEAEIAARRLGLIVGPEGVAMSKQYSAQMRDIGLVGKSLEIQFGNQLLPVFVQTGKWLGEEGPMMGQVFADILRTISVGAGMTWITLKDMGDGIGAIAAQSVALLHGDLAGVTAIGKARDEEVAKNEKAFEKIKATFSWKPEKESNDYGNEGRNNKAKDPQYHFKQKAEDADAAAPSRMGQWEAALSERKAAIERQGLLEGQYREMSKAEEQKYWDDLKNMQGLSAQERSALTRKAADTEMAGIKQNFEVKVASLQAEAAAYKNNTEQRMSMELQIQAKYQQGTKEYEASAKRIVEIQRQASEQQATIREARVQAERDARLSVMALEEQAMQQALQMGLVTQSQLLTAQQGFEIERTAIAKAALDQRLADSLLGDSNPVLVDKINHEIEALEQQHALRMGQIRGQMQVESSKYQTEFFQGLQSNLQGSLTNILSGTQKLGAGFKSMFTSIGQTLAQTVAKMVSTWATGQLQMKVASKETSLTQLNNSAVAAAGGAYNAIVGIPYVGPFLAPVAAGVAYAGVMAFGAMASAEGGFDIPGNVNPIVQTHAKEMILPAKHADVIRNLADSGGGAAGGNTVNYHDHTGTLNPSQIRDNAKIIMREIARLDRQFFKPN